MFSDLTFRRPLQSELSSNSAQLLKSSLVLFLCGVVMACGTTKNLADRRKVDLQDGFAAYEQGDYQQAFVLLEPLAEKGDAEAQTTLGNMYYLGLGVSEDETEAAQWFEKAAQQGDLEAHVMLGTLYVLGVGVPQDDSAAAQHFLIPAECGIGGAQFLLGTLYMYGQGVPENRVEAYKWLTLSADRGSEAAKNACALLSQQMTEKEITAASALVKDWVPRQPPDRQRSEKE